MVLPVGVPVELEVEVVLGGVEIFGMKGLGVDDSGTELNILPIIRIASILFFKNGLDSWRFSWGLSTNSQTARSVDSISSLPNLHIAENPSTNIFNIIIGRKEYYR